ncbi:MAG: hypothetical protein KUG79_15695 [Pseudomonadales bacterium]|nr:hypothetical protein [Pseudomonadales bacterium]
MYKNCLALVFTMLFLVACSGGSSSDNPPPLQTGRFVDSAVNGLHYETATQSGITNAAGEFNYFAGETVRFSLGGIELGSAIGAASLSPLTLLNVSSVDAARQAGVEAELLNRLVFLQSLDRDNNPDNGIDLSGLDDSLAEQTLDFSVATRSFAAGDYRRLVNENNGIYRSTTTALNHLLDTLDLDVEVRLPTIDRLDNDGDGTIDQIINYSYNDSGQLLLISDIDPATDTLLRSAAFEYDEHGNLASINETFARRDDQVLEDFFGLIPPRNIANFGLPDIGFGGESLSVAPGTFDLEAPKFLFSDEPNGDRTKQQIFDFDPVQGLRRYELLIDGNSVLTTDYQYDAVGNVIFSETERVELRDFFARELFDPTALFFHPLTSLKAFSVFDAGTVIGARQDDIEVNTSPPRRMEFSGSSGQTRSGLSAAGLRRRVYSNFEFSELAKTVLFSSSVYEYNTEGQLIHEFKRAEMLSITEEVTRETTESSTFKYSQGILTETLIDFDLPEDESGQGGLSFQLSYQFDESGVLSACGVNANDQFSPADLGLSPPNVASVIQSPYASEILVEQVVALPQQDCSGERLVEVDDLGRIIRLTQDIQNLPFGFPAPGLPLPVAQREFEYQNDRVSAIKADRDGDGEFEDLYSYSYSDQGDITEETRTRDGQLIFSRNRDYETRRLSAQPE